MRRVTEEMIRNAIRLSRKKRRSVYISKTAKGKGVDVRTLDPRTPEGRNALDAFLAHPARTYTFSGLGASEEPGAIDWRLINLSRLRRILVLLQVAVSLVMKGTPFKNSWYRWMGVTIGKNVEIMQMVWLDHFRPDLIFIGDNTLIGAFSRLTVHGYEGSGRFRYGLVEIGANCTLGAGTGTGPIKIEDNVRTLPGTTLSPYFARIRAGSIVGYTRPPVRVTGPAGEEAPADS